ncbi:MAG: ATP-dependent RNA helicase HrpA [Thermodesulfobacteriota bacterium]
MPLSATPATILDPARLNYPEELPISAHRAELVAAIRENQVVIVSGEPGSGKTTQLPKLCIEAGRGRRGRIGCTQPRRIAAISIAGRVAEELGPAGAGLVGYKIRFRDETSRNTRIKFMTDGILLAEAQQDRELRAYDTIIVDEAHERSLNIDFLLGLLRQILARRPELKLIITSATIDTEKFARAFGNAPVIDVAGRAYPVEVRYQPVDHEREEEGEETYVDRSVAAVLALRREDRQGDILIFMPTERDIRETVEALEISIGEQQRRHGGGEATVLPLFGRLSPGEQTRVFQPARGQKIVVATNVAETSITVPGIRYVIDTGLARIATYNPRARTHKLPVVPVSRASCDQRKGRCGRVGPGICIRLYSEEEYQQRPEFTPPEIVRTNLAEVILRMLSLHLGDPASFPFVDPPSPRAIRDGYALLAELEAIDERQHLTRVGQLMARLPLDPRIARMIIEARNENALREVAVIAAALSIQDPRVRPAEKEGAADAAHARFVNPHSDFLFFLNLWDTYHQTLEKIKSQSRMRKFAKSHYLSYLRLSEWLDIHEQIARILSEEQGFAMNSEPASHAAVHRALLSGNLRNIGLKKEKNSYQGAGGREMVIFPGSALYNKGGQWIMAAEVVETTRLYARTVANIQVEWLEPLARDLCRYAYSDPHWEKRRGQVVALEKATLFGLVIVAGRKVNYGRIRPEEARQLFIQAALVEGELQGDYDFLAHNRKLVADLQALEERVRRRDVLVDDQAIFAFYDQRLDRDVWDQAGLRRFLKKPGADRALRLAEADLLRQLPENHELEQFPAKLQLDGVELALSYTFAPGSEEDGVTVAVPLHLLGHLRPEVFEWLVPGLLLEKITFLLKSLPKSLRRPLVPVSQAAERLARELVPCEGSLYTALARAVQELYGVRVTPSDWAIDTLPPHLRFRFRLVDSKGSVLKESRRFQEIRTLAGTAIPDDREVAALRRQWERDGLGPESLPEVPAQLPITDSAGRLAGYLSPGLVLGAENRIALRLFAEQTAARQATTTALCHLFSQEFKQALKSLRKECAIPRQHWALCEGLGGHDELNAALWDFVQQEMFGVRDATVPGPADFARQVARVREQGIALLAKRAFEPVLAVLQARRETLDALNRLGSLSAQRGADFRAAVASLVPPDFLGRYSLAQLASLPRYLKALRLRLERAQVDRAKDEAKARQLAPFEERLARLGDEAAMSSAKRERLAEYREMVEEFKVSLFAQELKTAYPVSAKRLEEKWREFELLR